MLSKDMIGCECGRHYWRPGGSQMGSGYAFQNFTCESCGRYALISWRDGLGVILLVEPANEQAAVGYVNTTLAILARAYKKEWEALNALIDKAHHDKILRDFGLDPAKGCKADWRGEGDAAGHVFLDNAGQELPVEHKALHKALGGTPNPFVVRHDLIPPPTPPRVPEGVVAFVYRGRHENGGLLGDNGYVLVTPEESARAWMPPDPRRLEHDEFWAEVFTVLRDKAYMVTGHHLTIEPVEIPNQYYDDINRSEPWYTFTLYGDVKFEVGPRKRVFSITLTAPGPMDVSALRDVAARDNVTYEANEDYHHRANSVTIHAWGRDKLIEYLTLAVRVAGTAEIPREGA